MRFFVLFAPFALIVWLLVGRARVKAVKLDSLGWDELVARLQPVPIEGIAIVAEDYLRPTKGQIDLAPKRLWELIGGDVGIQRMYENGEILIALASYAQRWNFDESVVVAERMRRDGIILRRAALKLSIGFFTGNDAVHGPFSVQQVASSYYLMRKRLLALYETSHAGRYPTLAAAL